MVERRACSPWMATLLTGLVCLSVWQIIGCPGPPSAAFIVSQQLQPPVYSLLTAANASSAEPPYDLERLAVDDYSRLMNLTDFRFTMLSVCNASRPPLLLVLVHSAPSNVGKRSAIRATWGTPRDGMHLVFLVGAAPHPTHAQRLRDEQRQHQDLVQGSFRDAYRNMTYKHVMALKYAAYHCPRARYVLKTDDDVFVNMPTMMAFLSVELSAWGARRLLFCDPLWVSYAKRSFRSKWRVSFDEYRERQYPPYCAGWAILYSPDVVFALYREAQRSDYFWIDDVLVTGVLAARAHLDHTEVGRAQLLQRGAMTRLLQTNSSAADYSFLYGPPNLRPVDIRALWKAVDHYHQYHHTSTAVAAAALASAVGATDDVSEITR